VGGLYDREWLYTQYVVLKRNQREIANESGVCFQLVSQVMKKFGIPARNGLEHIEATVKNHEWLYNQVVALEKSDGTIGREQAVSTATVVKYRRRFGIPGRPRKGPNGFLTGVPKTAEHKHNLSEARKRWVSEHPERRPIRPTYLDSSNGRSVQRNIAWRVAETTIGRKLTTGEVVHHIDGNPANNDPDNLQILASQADHARLHNAKRKDGLFGSTK